jgi:hypothetical protein
MIVLRMSAGPCTCEGPHPPKIVRSLDNTHFTPASPSNSVHQERTFACCTTALGLGLGLGLGMGGLAGALPPGAATACGAVVSPKRMLRFWLAAAIKHSSLQKRSPLNRSERGGPLSAFRENPNQKRAREFVATRTARAGLVQLTASQRGGSLLWPVNTAPLPLPIHARTNKREDESNGAHLVPRLLFRPSRRLRMLQP